MKKVILMMVSLFVCLLVVIGCGKKADETKAISDVQTEAATMNTNQLRATTMEYKDAIVAKAAELDEIKDQLAEIPLTEMLGDQAKELQIKIEDLGSSLSALTERFQVYYAALKEQGGDLTGLEI